MKRYGVLSPIAIVSLYDDRNTLDVILTSGENAMDRTPWLNDPSPITKYVLRE